MFKTDPKSLEELSFKFKEQDIANLQYILEHLHAKKLSTLSDEIIQEAIDGLKVIGKLKLEGKIYAFHVDDSFAERQSGRGEGVELFLRQGNKLEDFFSPSSRDGVYQVEDAARYMKENDRHVVYTGPLNFGQTFLGLPHECDEEDPLRRSCLRDYEINQFLEEKIDVIKLDSLI